MAGRIITRGFGAAVGVRYVPTRGFAPEVVVEFAGQAYAREAIYGIGAREAVYPSASREVSYTARSREVPG